MYYTYILYSEKKDQYYIGYTSDMVQRLIHHNLGHTRSTKSGIPWQVVYTEIFMEKSLAIRREREIKRWKSRKLIEELIQSRGRPD
ncbi:MAG: GIY-YIG nuclease family protein [FCB group bacterium]|nr:GIY-YIG nuclease family protein [FCB group bacterium]